MFLVTRARDWLRGRLIHRLTREAPARVPRLSDFDRLCDEIRPADVLLIEGRSAVAEIIKLITQSPWSHAALYIGRLRDIEVPALRARIAKFTDAGPHRQLVLEAVLGKGTVVAPLDTYRDFRVRLCRPKGLAADDRWRVVGYAVERLGTDYDLRQLLDLARFLFPYGILPRRWRSSLFVHHAGPETRTVCSTLLAEAFQAVRFPILPVVRESEGGPRLYVRNARLFTPRDFDDSPYFEILKFPYHRVDDLAAYHLLPWGDERIVCDTETECYVPERGPPQAVPTKAKARNTSR